MKLDALDPLLEVDAERASVGDAGDGCGLGEILCRAWKLVNSLKEGRIVSPSAIDDILRCILGRAPGFTALFTPRVAHSAHHVDGLLEGDGAIAQVRQVGAIGNLSP